MQDQRRGCDCVDIFKQIYPEVWCGFVKAVRCADGYCQGIDASGFNEVFRIRRLGEFRLLILP